MFGIEKKFIVNRYICKYMYFSRKRIKINMGLYYKKISDAREWFL